nr:hypothetical protein [Bacilli bacterium]
MNQSNHYNQSEDSLIETYALQVASVLHKTGKGSFTIDEIVDKVKEIVKEEELVEPVMIEVQQVLINKYNYEIINTNIKFDIDI